MYRYMLGSYMQPVFRLLLECTELLYTLSVTPIHNIWRKGIYNIDLYIPELKWTEFPVN